MLRLSVRLALIAAVAASLAAAAPRTWVIINGTFDDGGTFSGSFAYDASTNTYSSIHVQTTGGSVFAPTNFTALNPVGFTMSASVVDFVNLPGQASYVGSPSLAFYFSAPLTDAGGTVNIISAGEFTCITTACDTLSDPRRFVTGGLATTAPPPPTVPTLSEWGMAAMTILLAGAALLAMRRFQATR